MGGGGRAGGDSGRHKPSMGVKTMTKMTPLSACNARRTVATLWARHATACSSTSGHPCDPLRRAHASAAVQGRPAKCTRGQGAGGKGDKGHGWRTSGDSPHCGAATACTTRRRAGQAHPTQTVTGVFTLFVVKRVGRRRWRSDALAARAICRYSTASVSSVARHAACVCLSC